MRSLGFSATEIDSDAKVKQVAAQKQMKELIHRLQAAPKYHTLTKPDRFTLKKEGYASELTDNLVVMTQRLGDPTSAADDQPIVGFTYAAFDPALYANHAIKKHFEALSSGCCCFCESFLSATSSGDISHYRPVQLLDMSEDKQTRHSECSPYYSLAYQQDNLLYVCPACDEQHKAGFFPLQGERFPTISLEQEQPLLINPYQEPPRDFIRFNPNNAQAYAFDRVCAFYLATQGLTPEQVENKLWQQPNAIPNQFDNTGNLLTDPKLEQDFHAWLGQQPQLSRLTRGQTSIQLLGLNRTGLLIARLATLRQLSADDDPNRAPPLSTAEIETNAYRSLALDALSTWYRQAHKTVPLKATNNNATTQPIHSQHEAASSQATEGTQAMSEISALAPAKEVTHSEASTSQAGTTAQTRPPLTAANSQSHPTHHKVSATDFPVWLRSCLAYVVGESELEIAKQRRLVCLSSKDRFYGEKSKEKCVFLAIDWSKDSQNVIKVRSHRNIWDASFAELAQTRPQELIELFANNDVWVEGAYPALSRATAKNPA